MQYLLVVTEDGYGKRIRVDEVRRTNRGLAGVNVSRSPVAVAIVVDDPQDHLVIATSSGKVERIRIGSVSGRACIGKSL